MLVLVNLSLVMGIAWWQLSSFAMKSTRKRYLGLVYLNWVMGASALVVLLPLDLALEGRSGETLVILWQINYWVTFTTSWVLCPIAMEYWASGDFDWKSRLVSAVKHNAKFYAAMSVVLAVAAILVGFKNGFGTGRVTGFLIAAANTYGMLLVVLLLGHGLVEIPRQAWNNTNPRNLLRWYYCTANRRSEELLDAQADLSAIVQEVYELEEDGGKYYDTIRLRAEEAERDSLADFSASRRTSSSQSSGVANGTSGALLGINRLSRLHSKLKMAAVKAQRAQCNMAQVVEQSAKLELLLERLETRQHHSLEADDQGLPDVPTLSTLPFTLRHRYTFWKVTAGSLSVASAVLLYNECVAPMTTKASLFALMLQDVDSLGLRFLFTALPLVYMAVCVYASLFKFKLLDSLALYKNHQTPAYALLGNASYFGRLQFSVGVNYVAMALTSTQESTTAFHSLLGDMEVVPFLGTSFNSFVPLLIVIVAVSTFFNVFDKFLNLLGIDTHEEPGNLRIDDSSPRLSQGKQVIERFRNREQRRAARAAQSEGRDQADSLVLQDDTEESFR